MPLQRNLSNVNIGTAANSGDGDTLRDAFTKVNDNLNSLYSGGQFLGFTSDQRLSPGYTWANDKDTGMYRIGPGRIGFSLNGADSLNLNEDGTITWYSAPLATQSYVNNLLTTFTGGINAANITVVTGSTSANITINDIDLIIVATSSPEQISPSTACIIHNKFNIERNIPAFDIKFCHIFT
jgi:hypothetical protein